MNLILNYTYLHILSRHGRVSTVDSLFISVYYTAKKNSKRVPNGMD